MQPRATDWPTASTTPLLYGPTRPGNRSRPGGRCPRGRLVAPVLPTSPRESAECRRMLTAAGRIALPPRRVAHV
jgi:hypothetical protein